MTQILWIHESSEDCFLKLKTDDGAVLTFFVEDGYVDIGGNELENDDGLYGLYVSINKQYYRLSDLFTQALGDFDDVMAETIAAEEDEDSHRAFYSSPYLSGGI